MATKRTKEKQRGKVRPTVIHSVQNKASDHEFTARLDEAFRRELNDPTLANTDVEKLVSSLASLILHYIIECSGDRVTLDLDLASFDHVKNRRYFLRITIAEELSGKDVM